MIPTSERQITAACSQYLKENAFREGFFLVSYNISAGLFVQEDEQNKKEQLRLNMNKLQQNIYNSHHIFFFLYV